MEEGESVVHVCKREIVRSDSGCFENLSTVRSGGLLHFLQGLDRRAPVYGRIPAHRPLTPLASLDSSGVNGSGRCWAKYPSGKSRPLRRELTTNGAIIS